MNKKIIAVITDGDSDLLDLIKLSNIRCTAIKADDILNCDLDDYDSIMILGGTSEAGITLGIREANLINRQVALGKRVFTEYTYNVHHVYITETKSTRYERPIFVSDSVTIDGLSIGDILDEQCNNRLNLWKSGFSGKPILQYVRNAEGYYQTKVTEETMADRTCTALWFETENLLMCSFRLVNFVKARFCPIKKWQALLGYIMNWVTGETVDFEVLADAYNKVYHFNQYNEAMPFEEQIRKCARDGLDWFTNADMLVKKYGNYYGVKEGLGPAVYADGTQQIMETLRTDCIGETAAAFFMDYLLDKNKLSGTIADRLLDVFKDNSFSEGVLFKGMNGGNGGGICYQDDNARGVLFPILLRALYSGDKEHLKICTDTLDFLVRTTGKDGLRVVRTEMIDPLSEVISGMNLESYNSNGITKWRWGFFEKNLSDLAKEDGYVPSAHYNGYYLAVLLLAYQVTGNETYKEVGIKGMESLMAFYPETAREHSETQERCRLIFPLAMLYWVTKDEKHKEWLYTVSKDLQRTKHPTGGYLEWDTNYIAVCSNVKDNECSVLANNGDPITDMIYSLNWLPLGFIQAYFVTDDVYFKELWEDISRFFISTQVQSENKQINGVWARALDVDLMEVYGVPNDIGWAPWSVESGWTIGEIVTGLIMGIMEDDLKKYYR